MELLADLGVFCNGVKELAAGVLGVRGHEAQAEFARKLRNLRHEVGKVHAAGQILAIRIDVLAQQGDLLVARGDQPAALLQHVLRAAAALTAAHVGHDAVGAEIVAAVHHGHPCLERVRPCDGDMLGDGAGGILRGKNALACRQHVQQQLRELPQMVRGKHAVHVGIGFFDALGHLRLAHHAAADEDLLPRVAALGMHQRADVAEHALLGVLADGAGVQDDDVRALLGVREAVARALQHPADALGVRLVLLAAVGIHKGKRGHALHLPVFLNFAADRGLTLQRLRRNDGRFCFQRGCPPHFVLVLYFIISAAALQDCF